MFCVALIAVASLTTVQVSPAVIWDHPHQAAVLHRHWDTSEFRYACSGAIVSQTHILTTASCSGDSYENLRVRVGSSYHQSGGDLHPVRDVFRHPNFTADYDSDIALLQLATGLRLGRRVAAVNLPKQDEKLGSVSGGRVSSWVFDSNAELQAFGDLQVVSNCNNKFDRYSAGKELVTDNMICIDYVYIRGLCNERNQGGSLVLAGTLYGLSSWSYQCGGSDTFPSVFTRVSAFTAWIEIIIKL